MAAPRETAPGAAVVVTDAADPVGRATALMLADRGLSVLACDADAVGMGDLPRETAQGGLIEVLVEDASTPTGARAAVARTHTVFGRFDGVVCCASAAAFGALEQCDDDAVERAFARNVLGPLALVRAALPGLRAQGHGRIVLISSVAGRAPLPLGALYTASHHALEGLADAARMECRPFGVHVAVVEPGLVSSIAGKQRPGSVEHALRLLDASGPYGPLSSVTRDLVRDMLRHGARPRDVAAAVHTALTDKKPRSRYPVTRRAGRLLKARRVVPGRQLRARIAEAFGVTDDKDS